MRSLEMLLREEVRVDSTRKISIGVNQIGFRELCQILSEALRVIGYPTRPKIDDVTTNLATATNHMIWKSAEHSWTWSVADDR